jgi:uncharacterized coiled-coil protein SlyX
MGDETNSVPTAEEFAAVKAELEAEKAKSVEAVTTATQALQERVTSLETEISTKTQDIEALKGQLTEASTNFEGAKAAYAYAVDDYRKLILQTNPLFTEDIIVGSTIDEVKTSVEKAGFLVDKVKSGLENQAKALAALTSVPAGAPARTGANTEAMSTKEKINYGLEQARKKKEA